MPTGKATTQLLGCCSTLGTRIFHVSSLPGADTQQGSPAESGFSPGVFSLHCSGCGHGTAGTDLLSHRCSFQKWWKHLELCWPSKEGLQQLPPGADSSCKTRGEVGNGQRRGMLSTNKPKISCACGKNIYNMESDHLEFSLQDCFHCLWLKEVLWLCYTAWAISLHGKFIPSCPKTGVRREFHTLPKALIKLCIKNKSLPAAGIQ